MPLKTYYFILLFILFHLFQVYLHNLDYYFLFFPNLDLEYYLY